MKAVFLDNIETDLTDDEKALRQDSASVIEEAILRVQPGPAVRAALRKIPEPAGRTVLIAAGKAAWEMAEAAYEAYPGTIDSGLVVTKYGHSRGPIRFGCAGPEIIEAGHPIPDKNSVAGAEKALSLVRGLKPEDRVLFLLSGGGSALFEAPRVPLAELRDITDRLLASGADIVSINTIRKRLSAVKGGRFALAAMPAQVYTVVLSDIVGDPLDMIASGPAYPDSSTSEDALAIAERYGLNLSEEAKALLREETPKSLPNVTTYVTGSVRELVKAAAEKASALGYSPVILTESLTSEARDAGTWFGKLAKAYSEAGGHGGIALLAGGETVVHLNDSSVGNGTGGRNQELALAAAKEIDGCEGVSVFSFGSDGTDGPTDAAGGIVSGKTAERLRKAGVDADRALNLHDSCPALRAAGGLIMTGPTGTNVNDLAVALIRRRDPENRK